MENFMKRNKIGKNELAANFKENIPMFVMFAPFLIFFVLFTVLPIFSSLALSFTSYDLIASPVFNGIDNYKRLIVNDMTFAVTVKNTLVFAIVAGPLGFLLSFILAWAVNEFSPGARAFMSLMFYAPSLVGNAYFIWQVAFSGDSYGYINSMLLSLGIITEPITWLKNEAYLMPIIIVVQLWQSMGVSFLANISGLQNINRDLYEAALYNTSVNVAYAAFQCGHADTGVIFGQRNRGDAGRLPQQGQRGRYGGIAYVRCGNGSL